jgi:hypothetical protein
MSFADSLESSENSKARGSYIIRVIIDETDELKSRQTHFIALVQNKAKPVKQSTCVANTRGPRWRIVD